MGSLRNALIVISVSAVVATPSAGQRVESVARIHLSPLGSDANDGTAERPVRSLARANELLIARRPSEPAEVRIRSDLGAYSDQTVRWTYYHPAYPTRIEAYPEGTRAVFAADQKHPPTDPFFTLDAADGAYTRVHIVGIEVRNYASPAFCFHGDREHIDSRWNGGNILSNCAIHHIGDRWAKGRSTVYGVITFVNSRSNRVESCLISDCENRNRGRFPQGDRSADALAAGHAPKSGEDGADLPIIAIYLAHGSSGNRIVGNTMKNIKGDCVRIRDASGENVIEKNVFERAGWNAACTMWYCDGLSRECRGQPLECPSYDNVFRDNELRGNWECGPPLVFKDLRPRGRKGCGPERPTSARILCSGNSVLACR